MAARPRLRIVLPTGHTPLAMYAALRTEQGEYVDAKVWKASAKALAEAAKRCRDSADQLFWQDTFKPIMDEAVPK